jgi:cobalamin biosynthesis protein CbiG
MPRTISPASSAGSADANDEQLTAGPVVVGVGARRGTGIADLRAAIADSLVAAEVGAHEVVAIVTVDAKQSDPALQEMAGLLGVPLRALPADLLAQQPVPNPSAVAQRLVGTPSVAEGAVLAVGAELLLPKQVFGGITIAVGRLPTSEQETTTTVQARTTHRQEPI